jgi:hypothetical protein
MEEIFIAIMERIAEKIPELSYIDEDYGQLEAGAEEDHYPVTFPCVLIGNAESDWNDLGYGVQKSESFITIRLAVDCYDDTHYTSGTYDKVRERQLKAKEPVHGRDQPAGQGKEPGLFAAGKHQGVRDGLFLHAA